jgi:hypothetical protein
MKIKVFTGAKSFKIVNVLVTDQLKNIANKFDRWEYVL